MNNAMRETMTFAEWIWCEEESHPRGAASDFPVEDRLTKTHVEHTVPQCEKAERFIRRVQLKAVKKPSVLQKSSNIPS